MSYRFPMDGLVHYALGIDEEAVDAALPDGDVHGVRARCNVWGNRLSVPIDKLSLSAVVTCLVCIAKGPRVR